MRAKLIGIDLPFSGSKMRKMIESLKKHLKKWSTIDLFIQKIWHTAVSLDFNFWSGFTLSFEKLLKFIH